MPKTTNTNTPTHTPAGELQELLRAGGEHSGWLYMKAAVHLLTFTELPHMRGFVQHLRVTQVTSLDGREVTIATVKDWRVLQASKLAGYMGGADTRLLMLAVGFATAEPVDVRECVGSLGHAHARRVMEAFAIATGADELYTVTPTAELTRRLAERDAMFGPVLDEFAEDVLGRCRSAKANHGGHPNAAWSTGEQLAVALVLNDEEHLAAMEYTHQEAARRVRDGMANPPEDIEAWLDKIRTALAAGR